MKTIQSLLACCFFSIAVTAQDKPNVIFILADDLGYGDIGCYGQKLIETPNINKLAAAGMKFTNFYSGTSVCAPSRSALMTGQHTGHTPIRGNREVEPEGQLEIPAAAFTIAELFKKANYTTGAFGKWGLGFVGTSGDPNKQGFDQFFGYNCQRQSHNFFPGHLWDNEKRIVLSNTATDQRQYAPDLIQQKALAFMDKNKTIPFFMYLAYTLPHAALQLPRNDTVFELYKKKFNEQPRAVNAVWDGKGYQPQAYPHAAYAAMVTKLDLYVGEVIEKLKALGLEKNTLIVFTSDNGPHREGGNEPEFFNSSGNLRGIKRDLYEGGIRVPMIAYWPAVIRKKQQSHLPAASWDFFPTFADILGQPIPSAIDGISILAALQSQGKQRQHEFLYWEFHEQGGRQAVRVGDWKAVRQDVKKDKNGPIELYNLAKDRNNKCCG
jgi:arylsulfatase A-like enzyme